MNFYLLLLFFGLASTANLWVDLWANHLKHGLMRYGKLQTAAIISLQNGALVAGPAGVKLTNLEGRELASHFAENKYWETKNGNVTVFGKNYEVTKYDYPDKILAKGDVDSVILAKNKMTLVIAVYNFLTTAAEAEKLVDDFVEYIRTLGY
ncbi:unnamed protein product, partial [Mesorhabditis spiculigera]